ncbi:MAG: helix-turn-helix domain-containing protein [Candidatus Fimenecus sp.]
MNIKLADRLVALRKQKGYSQEVLAEKLGLSRQSISKWERAEASPDTDNLIALAEIYHMTLDELLGNGESVPKKEVKEEKKLKEKTPMTKAQIKGKKLMKIMPIISIAVVVVYVLVGFALKIWHPTWMMFLLIPLLLTVAISLLAGKTKRITALMLTSSVSLLAVIAYLFAGLVFHMWAVAWIVFLAIPVYAYIAFLLTKTE